MVTNSGTAQNAILNFVIPRGDTGPQGAPGSLGSVYAQYVVNPKSYNDGDYLNFYTAFRNGTGISLATDETTMVFEPGYIYLYSYILQALLPAGGYIQALPVTGRQEERDYTAYGHSSSSNAPVSASGSFTFYTPVTTYMRMRFRSSHPTTVTGSVSLSRIFPIR